MKAHTLNPAGTPTQHPSRKRSPLPLVALALAGLVLVASGAAWWLWGRGPSSPTPEYTTEQGQGAGEGTVNSPLEVATRASTVHVSPQTASGSSSLLRT